MDQLPELLTRLANEQGHVTAEEFDRTTRRLQWLVRRRFPGMPLQDAEDVAAETVGNLVQRIRGGQAVPSDGYVATAVINAAISALREQGRRPFLLATGDVPERMDASSDDEVAAALEATATAEAVQRALRAALDDGDQVAFRVVTVALDEAQSRGERPSNRQIAEMLGISHTAVGKALTRFRTRLDDLS